MLADVSALKLTPEQVAQFLQLAAAGQLPLNNGTGQFGATPQTTSQTAKADYGNKEENKEHDDLDEEDMEDYEDEK